MTMSGGAVRASKFGEGAGMVSIKVELDASPASLTSASGLLVPAVSDPRVAAKMARFNNRRIGGSRSAARAESKAAKTRQHRSHQDDHDETGGGENRQHGVDRQGC